MKKIAVLFAAVIGIGMLFSSTCKQPPYEVAPPSWIDTGQGTVVPPHATLNIVVRDSINVTQTGDIQNAVVCVFNTLSGLQNAKSGGPSVAQNTCLNNPGPNGGTLTTGNTGYYSATFIALAAYGPSPGTTYYIYAFNPAANPTPNRWGDTTLTVQGGQTISTTVILY